MEEPAEVTADRIVRELLLPHRNDSNSEININAGGAGAWIAVWVTTVACGVMVTGLLVGALWMSRELNRIDSRFNDQTDVDSVQDAYIHKLRAEQKQEKR